MAYRILITAGAFLLAGIILLIALSAGESGATPQDAERVIPRDRMAPPPDLAHAGDGRTVRPTRVRDVLFVCRLPKQETTIEIQGEEARPLAEGRHFVVLPRVIIRVDENRRVVINAPEGRILAPQGEIQEGILSGGRQAVVVTLYESPPGEAPIYGAGSPHVALRAYLDHANFYMDRTLIQSRGPIHITGPRFDFTGDGLDLTYNTVANALVNLTVHHGRLLRIKMRDPVSRQVASKPDRADGGDARASDRPPVGQQADSGSRVQWYIAELTDEILIRGDRTRVEDAQQMLVHFATGGRWRVEDAVKSGADGSEPRERTSRPALASNPSRRSDTRPRIRPASSAPEARRIPMAYEDLFALHALAPVDDDDVYVTWDGPLTVNPVEPEEAPADVAGPDDMLAELAPVTVIRERGADGDTRTEALKAARADYLASQRRIRLTGSRDTPLTMTSESLGTIAALPDTDARLVVYQNEGRGVWSGPGRLDPREERVTPDAGPEVSDDAVPGSLAVTWQRGIDLDFFLRDPNQVSESDPLLIRALKRVAFRGDVETRHPDFDLDTEQLALRFTDPGASGKTVVRAISAEGGNAANAGRARLVTRAESTRREELEQPLDVAARTLKVFVEPNDTGQLDPRRIEAFGDIDAAMADQRIEAGELDVDIERVENQDAARMVDSLPKGPVLAEEQPTDVAAAPVATTTLTPEPASQLVVTSLNARSDVRITLPRKKTTLTADRVAADPQLEVLELFGAGKAPAEVRRQSGTLAGMHVTLVRDDGQAQVVGPGWMTYQSRGPVMRPIGGVEGREVLITGGRLEAAPGEPRNGKNDSGDDKLTTTRIGWSDQMHFSNADGTANFYGNVHVDSRDERERVQVWSDRARVLLTPDAEANADRNADAADDLALDLAGRQVLRVVGWMLPRSKQDTVLQYDNWTDRIGGELAQRLYLSGRSIDYRREAQQVLIDSAGRMLIEDLVAEDAKAAVKGEAGAKADESDKPFEDAIAEAEGLEEASNLEGKGRWYFRWDRDLRVDIGRNNAVMRENVQMVHQPLGEKKRFRLYADELEARFDDIGGVEAIEKGEAKEPQLASLHARGIPGMLSNRVRFVTETRTVEADSADFDVHARVVNLFSEPGQWVQLTNTGDPTTYPARRVRYDLASDKVRFIGLGAIIVPER